MYNIIVITKGKIANINHNIVAMLAEYTKSVVPGMHARVLTKDYGFSSINFLLCSERAR